MKAVFSTRFRADLLREEIKYREVSERLATALRERVAGQVSEVIRWRRTKPFPFFIYYKLQGEAIHFLGLVHERRQPDFLRKQLRGRAND